jgi:hypothetical protein
MTAEDREADALDAALSDILWRGQLDPERTPRIIHSMRVQVGFSFALPGHLWPDGRARVVVNPVSHVNVGGVLRQLATMDEPQPGAEPPALAGDAS